MRRPRGSLQAAQRRRTRGRIRPVRRACPGTVLVLPARIPFRRFGTAGLSSSRHGRGRRGGCARERRDAAPSTRRCRSSSLLDLSWAAIPPSLGGGPRIRSRSSTCYRPAGASCRPEVRLASRPRSTAWRTRADLAARAREPQSAALVAGWIRTAADAPLHAGVDCPPLAALDRPRRWRSLGVRARLSKQGST
jgi:hypothetical protein